MSDEELKRGLRRRARSARESRVGSAAIGGTAEPTDWATSLRRLDELIRARTVAAYTSYGTEPALDELLRELLADGVRVLLPVLRADLDLDWVEVADPAELPVELLRSESAGLAGRVVRADLIAAADVVLVPALLVATDGVRLGQGGGSYDRALDRVSPGTPIVAVVHDDELVEAGTIPRAEHDRLVTHAATPTRLVPLRG